MRIAVMALVCTLAARASWAADMENHDLASLSFLSSDVVYADLVKRESPKDQGWNITSTYRVTRVLQGSLKVGASIALSDGLYNRELPQPWIKRPDGSVGPGPELKVEPRTLLFLARSPDGTLGEVPSGMRLFAGGRIYRYEQFSNPGGYDPTPQGQDPADAFGRDRDTIEAVPARVVSEADFAAMLTRAQARAAEVRKVLAEPAGATRNRDLVALLPPPRRFPEPVPYQPTRGGDAIGRALLEAIWVGQDPGSIVASLGREVPLLYGQFRHGPDTLDEAGRQRLAALLLGVARDRRQPTHQRVGALEQLADWIGFAHDDARQSLAELGPLLLDDDPAVRAAAALAVAWRSLDQRALVRRPLTAAVKRERDDGALVGLGMALERLESTAAFFAALPKRRLAFVAVPEPGASLTRIDVSYRYVLPGQTAPTISAVHLTRAGSELAVDLRPLTGAQGTSWGDGIIALTPKATLAAGHYQVVLEYQIGGQRHLSSPVALDLK